MSKGTRGGAGRIVALYLHEVSKLEVWVVFVLVFFFAWSILICGTHASSERAVPFSRRL